jgi:hypothetical protein
MRIKNQNGFSLTELLVATAAATFIIMVSAITLINAQQNYKSMVEKINSEEEVHNAEFQLRNMLSMAVNVREVPDLADMSSFTNNEGKIRKMNLDDWTASTGPGEIEPIAFFLQENLISAHTDALAADLIANPDKRFLTSGIFLQRPTVDKYGILYLHSQNDTTAEIMPNRGDMRIGHVVDFEVIELATVAFEDRTNDSEDADLIGDAMVTSALLKVVVRNYLPHDGVEKLTWCPARFMATEPDCATAATYKDYERLFQFQFRNNVLERGFAQKDSSGVKLPIYRRNADTIYYLKPNLPIGTISR